MPGGMFLAFWRILLQRCTLVPGYSVVRENWPVGVSFRFFASLIQRAAKMNKNLGGGSMTLLLVAPGMPATGQASPSLDPGQYQTLNPELRDKLMKALAAKPQEPSVEASGASIRTEVKPFCTF
jgi:hypothetical protein